MLARVVVTVLLCTLLAACDALRPTGMPQPIYYSLDNARSETRAAAQGMLKLSTVAPTLIVNPPHAASGYDSQRIIYMREPHQLSYYADNKWVDTPARMITPLIIDSIGSSGTFRAVVLTPSAAIGDMRLDTEIVRLQHDLGHHPTRVRFTLRASILDNTTRQVMAWREFDEAVLVKNENPYGVVVAANSAVQNVLGQLAQFCTEAAVIWKTPAADILKVNEERQ
jgi:cholesterol transport system auxiliary component